MENHSSEETSSQVDEVFLLVENKRKSNNMGPLLRCACAFGVDTIIAVGYDKCAVEGGYGIDV